MPLGIWGMRLPCPLPPTEQQIVELGAGALDALSFAEPSHHVVVVAPATRVVVGIECQRNPELDTVVVDIEPGRHDPHHRAELAVDLDSLPDSRQVGSEGSGPKLMGEDDYCVVTRTIFFGGEYASDLRAHAQHIE